MLFLVESAVDCEEEEKKKKAEKERVFVCGARCGTEGSWDTWCNTPRDTLAGDRSRDWLGYITDSFTKSSSRVPLYIIAP